MGSDHFSTRLHAACEKEGIPDRGRAAALHRALNARGHKVSIQGVRKWLDGVAMPTLEKIAALATILNCGTEELASGRQLTQLPKSARTEPLVEYNELVREIARMASSLSLVAQAELHAITKRMAQEEQEKTIRKRAA